MQLDLAIYIKKNECLSYRLRDNFIVSGPS